MGDVVGPDICIREPDKRFGEGKGDVMEPYISVKNPDSR